jgi:hypothetical protein
MRWRLGSRAARPNPGKFDGAAAVRSECLEVVITKRQRSLKGAYGGPIRSSPVG